MNCNGISFFPSNFMFHNSQEEEHRAQTSLNPDFHGVESFLGKRSLIGHVEMNGEDDTSDEGSLAGEKKRRLSIDQVKTLEKNFELGNKLEPERKMQLARVLGLQPRQIATWFQNRRARWKTKQLEKDYDLLVRQYETVKADNEQLRTQNQHLHAEIVALKSRDSTESINLNKETDQGSSSNRSENSSDIKLDISRAPAIDGPIARKGHFPMFFGTSRQDHAHLQKIEQMGKEDNLGNMFCSIDDHSGLWPWIEQQHFS